MQRKNKNQSPAPSAGKRKDKAVKNKWNKLTRGYHALVWTCLAPVAVLLLVAAAAPPLQAAQRPIEDFLSSQGKYIYYGYFGMFWTDPFETDGATYAEIDYAGIKGAIMEYYGYPSLGTTFSGTVTERPLKDGRAEVEVVLHTYHALAWAASDTWEYLFGHDFVDVLLNDASLAFGDCTLKLKFINTAPNAPLPDFWDFYFGPPILPDGVELLSVQFVGQADGLMADGSPGRMQITQVGLLAVSPPKPPLFDSYPVEHILLKRVGH
jgi:hypothetical protein